MHALSAHAWDYLPALKTVFESVGLDYLYPKLDKKSRFRHIHLCFHYDLRRSKFMLLNKSSFTLEDVSQAR
jgi:hypothetical protein